MTKVEFLSLVYKSRNLDLTDFLESIRTCELFPSIMKLVERSTHRHGKNVGILTPKKEPVETKPTDSEKAWITFFSSHTFSGMEEQRKFADFAQLITGVSVTKHMNAIPKGDGVSFPAFVCIVPTGNTNFHNYALGEPILNLFMGRQFYRRNGRRGNDMSTSIREYRLANTEEIEKTILLLLWSNSDSCDILADAVMSRDSL